MIPIVKLYVSILFKFVNHKKKPPVIILTPGKVGSSSVYFTLKKTLQDYSVYHIHFSDINFIESSINSRQKNKRPVSLHYLISYNLIKKLSKFNGEVKIITLTREPVSRAISSFFQNIFDNPELEDKNLRIDELKSVPLIKKNVIDSLNWLEWWFDTQIHEIFGINVFDKNLNNEPFHIFTNKNFKLLFMKMENLNNNFEKASKIFFKFENGLTLSNSNVGEKKYYSSDYLKIKKQIKFNKNELQKISSSKYFRLLYVENENDIKQKFSTQINSLDF